MSKFLKRRGSIIRGQWVDENDRDWPYSWLDKRKQAALQYQYNLIANIYSTHIENCDGCDLIIGHCDIGMQLNTQCRELEEVLFKPDSD